VKTEDRHAQFSQWMSAHAAVLHHVALGFAEGADRYDRMQELMLAVWQALPAFRGGAQPVTFLYRVAHNTALTWKRSQKNYRRRVERYESQPFLDTSLPEVGGREKETLERIYPQIRTLPPVDRSLILLHLDGVSYAETAHMHGQSETNVGAQLSRLKQKLTDSMKRISHELR